MADVNMKRNDTSPKLGPFTLRDRAGRPVDLTEAQTVTLHVATDANALKFTGACVVLSPATAGRVTYAWAATDLDTAGNFRWQVQVTWKDGGKTTYPTLGHKTLLVEPDFDAA